MSSLEHLPSDAQTSAPTAVDRSDQREAICAIGPLVNLAPVLRSLGCDADRVFENAGYSPDQFDNPDLRLPFAEASHFLNHCVEASNCAHLGLLLGHRGGASHLGLAGFLVRTAPTVERALKVLVEYLDLSDEAGHVTLEVDSKLTTLAYVIHVPDIEAADQIYDMSMAVGCNMLRALCGDTWRPKEVRLQRTMPDEVAPYRRVFRAPIRFNASETAITISSHWLAHRAPTADELMYRYLEREAVELHERRGMSLMDALPAVLGQGLQQERFSAPEIAAALGMHERTLHRRLRDHGTSFRRELDTVRLALSQQMLRATHLTIEEIAVSLGYTSSSAYIRAFQRWADTTPMRWRELHRRH